MNRSAHLIVTLGVLKYCQFFTCCKERLNIRDISLKALRWLSRRVVLQTSSMCGWGILSIGLFTIRSHLVSFMFIPNTAFCCKLDFSWWPILQILPKSSRAYAMEEQMISSFNVSFTEGTVIMINSKSHSSQLIGWMDIIHNSEVNFLQEKWDT